MCYWLIDQGIIPIFSDPASPQQNGRHERMHRELKSFNRIRIQTTLIKQQKIADDFREEYNTVRPHESLNMKTPISAHKLSPRPFSEKKIIYDYPYAYKETKVTVNGAARWGAYHWLFIGRGASGRYVAAQEMDNDIWNMYYRNVLLGYFDKKLFVRKEQYQKLTQFIV